MLGASSGQGLFWGIDYVGSSGQGLFYSWYRVINLGISACMAREGSFTFVRRELRPRAGISACMVTGGWSFTHVRRELWPRVILGYRLWDICMHGQGREFYSC